MKDLLEETLGVLDIGVLVVATELGVWKDSREDTLRRLGMYLRWLGEGEFSSRYWVVFDCAKQPDVGFDPGQGVEVLPGLLQRNCFDGH